jgi:hypothetical protein
MSVYRFRLRTLTIVMVGVPVGLAALVLLALVLEFLSDWGLTVVGMILVTPDLVYPLLGCLLLIGFSGGIVGASVYAHGELKAKRRRGGI